MTRARRRVLGGLAAVAVLSFAGAAFGGSYLDRAALLLDQARREGDMMIPRTGDKELVKLVKALAEARSKAARKMDVPSQVIKAHPHLLLVLESYERAADAALEGSFKKFMEHINTARDEEKLFRVIIAELGYSLPDVGAKK